MKPRTILLPLLLFPWIISTFAQKPLPDPIPTEKNQQKAGTLLTSERMYSKILGDTVRYSLYLPHTYTAHAEERFPVLYLLHGLGDDHLGWINRGNIKTIADTTTSYPSTIIVMPDAGKSWYVNSYDSKVRYEDMFIEEFIPHIDRTLRTRAQKINRSIAGLSMGGHGALLYSIKHPELFHSCSALSAAVYTDEDFLKRRSGSFPELFDRIFGPVQNPEHWQRNNVLRLMAAMPEGQKTAVNFWIDCGDDDFLYRGNSMLHIIMRDQKIPHQYRVRDGGHTWNYWQSAMPQVLQNNIKKQ